MNHTEFQAPAITPTELANHGYKKYPTPDTFSSELWQKAFVDNKGIKYFIDFYKYDFTSMKLLYDISFGVKIQLTTKQYGTIDITMHVDSLDTVDIIEDKVSKLFDAVDAEYYEY